MNREEIINLLEVVTSAYPHAKIKDAGAMVTAWELVLGEYSAEAVYKATRLHISTNKYFPSPSDIRDNIIRADLIYNVPETHQRALEGIKKDDTVLYKGKRYNKAEFEIYADKYVEAIAEFLGLNPDGIPNENVVFPILPDEVTSTTEAFLPYEL